MPAKFAETQGVSRKTATKWKQSGHLVFCGKFVDVEKSEARLRDAGLGRFKDDEGVTNSVTQGNKAANDGAAARHKSTGAKSPIVDLPDPDVVAVEFRAR